MYRVCFAVDSLMLRYAESAEVPKKALIAYRGTAGASVL